VHFGKQKKNHESNEFEMVGLIIMYFILIMTLVSCRIDKEFLYSCR